MPSFSQPLKIIDYIFFSNRNLLVLKVHSKQVTYVINVRNKFYNNF